MQIDIRNLERQRLFRTTLDRRNLSSVVKPPGGDGPEVYLNWDQALDDHGHLRHCPVCGARDLFVRKDLPQVTAFVLIVLAAVLAMALFGFRRVLLGVLVLVVVALIDFGIFFFAGRCLVCYRCRSEFRDLPIQHDHPRWELAVAERYRQTTGQPPQAAAPQTPCSAQSPQLSNPHQQEQRPS